MDKNNKNEAYRWGMVKIPAELDGEPLDHRDVELVARGNLLEIMRMVAWYKIHDPYRITPPDGERE